MLSLRLLSSLLWLAMLGFAVGVQNIQTFGAVPNDSSLSAADTNAKAIQLAFLAAQGGQNADERTVYVPSGGAGSFFFIHPVYVANFDDITFRIDGVLRASDDIANWPKKADNVSAANIFEFQNTTRFTIMGNGAVDGQGYNWWVAVILKKIKDKRPHMFVIGVSQHLTISGVSFFNSPQFHFKLDDVDQVDIRNIIIKVDVSKQRTLLESYGLFEKGLPTFPLNTDGIDPSGSNVYIRNVSIENYDDAVAVKPAHGGRVYAQCAENITVVDSYVRFGVGMTIGSVPPNSQVNCVRNVTFRNIVFDKPFKAIYIKTNPGSVGTGIISNILYENITVNDPIWWGIYIGPQQQKQPDGGGPGCMFYPLNKDCPTQPRVSIDHVTLRNVHIKGALLSPGILRCNESNPCTDFVFDNVTVDGWLSKVNFICENIQGVAVNSSYPIPACLKKQEFSD